MPNNPVAIGSSIRFGRHQPLALIAGPCVIETHELTLSIARRLSKIQTEFGIPIVFKASFDKANRSSIVSFRGPGVSEGLRTLAAVREWTGLPVTTDVHETNQVDRVAEVCDLLQIPALLARQTDLIAAVAATGRPMNIKKGQFMAPWDMKNAVAKAEECGNSNVLLTERGSTFGFGRLVNDMRAIPIMQETGCPVVFDATHSVQLPGSEGSASGGERAFIPLLARAAVAAGCDGLFLEVHPDPMSAKSDAACMLQLDNLPTLIEDCLRIHEVVCPLGTSSESANKCHLTTDS